LDPTGTGRKRWTMRWKAALQAFDITFDGRLTRTPLNKTDRVPPFATQTHAPPPRHVLTGNLPRTTGSLDGRALLVGVSFSLCKPWC
ncbi:hypothetical protein ACWCY6_44320, partial [Streptomyces sp. 900105755]